MDNNILSSTRVYTDIQSLDKVKYLNSTDQSAAKKEVAQQFEAILMQMVMNSMREANKAFSKPNDFFSSDQMDMYQDMFDKQLSLMMSNTHLGFADIVEKSLSQEQSPVSAPVGGAVPNIGSPAATQSTAMVAAVPAENAPAQSKQPPFKTPEDFIKHLWAYSKQAAGALGLSPEVLLAQAALETNWGKNVIAESQNGSSHNLFNIKADPNWADKTAPVDTLEQIEGVIVKQKSSFRSYGSFEESFQDYVNLLKTNDRYSEALTKTASPDQFMSSLQKAGYATDQNYADKVMKIYNSSTFKQAITKIKANDLSFPQNSR